jgi:transposase
MRMTRSGNRQLNAARIDGGASTPEALRSLKRRLARVVFHHLNTGHQTRVQPCQPAAA